MAASRIGYPRAMTHQPEEERPIELKGVPEEEGNSVGDAAERLDKDPEEQKNYTDPEPNEDDQSQGS
jgi:hypothetical protein